jgi:hypothetical protein
MHPSNRTKTGVMVTAACMLLAACGSEAPKTTTTTSSRPTGTSSTTTTSSEPAGTSSPSTSPTTLPSSVATTTVPLASPDLYVYPFSSLEDAEAWRREANPGGHQPWHFDAGFIATSFAKALGVPEIAQVIKVREDATGAHVALGFHNPNGVPVTAWTVHLVRVGSGSGRPWEVVGDDQSAGFTLTTPTYGAVVSSPVRVGGRITGVDENIRVRAFAGASNQPIGEHCCLPAGGVASPWSTTLAFSATTARVLVITASTGGHVQAIERLVFTAVQHTG